jgi:glycosyltransferase involved in cell wall biosynthesis
VPTVSVTVITLNEEVQLDQALRSVAWADELIVVDAMSRDRTVSIARAFTDRVVCREWTGYVDQKNYAASLATHDWILSLDADERVTPALAREIQARMSTADPPAEAAFRMPRTTWYLGRWVRTTDWYPDYQVRLYDRARARWSGGSVHEGIEADGPVGGLRGELLHYAYRDLSEHVETIDRYTTAAALDMHRGGRAAGLTQLAVHPLLAFARNYVARGGIRDGAAGLVISAMNAHYTFLKFAKLWELNRASRNAAQGPLPSAPGTAGRRPTP